MKALSLSQPWAHVVMHGPKNIENRKPNLLGQARALVGHRIALHAAKSWDEAAAPYLAGITVPTDLPRGALLGFATIARVFRVEDADVEPDQRLWTFGPICIELVDKQALAAPIPCRGMLGFWELPKDVSCAVAVQRYDLIPELVTFA